jgi:hypothetical protein
MNVSPDVNFEELARSTDDFNAAQLKAVCVEAGMLALRRDATEVGGFFQHTFDCPVMWFLTKRGCEGVCGPRIGPGWLDDA